MRHGRGEQSPKNCTRRETELQGPNLPTILESTRSGLAALRARRADIERRAAGMPVPRPFANALASGTVALIAEVKRRSPSIGAINPGLDPVALAEAYAAGGAAAVSVLTDGPFFGGSIADLERVATAVAVPVLRKDFIVDELQLVEARAAGAAAALLIVRALDQPTLVRLSRCAAELGLAALVEVHDAPELDRALAVGAGIIGVNARNLDTFAIDRPAAWALLATIPAGRIVVAESGMATRADVEEAARAGADAVLIGSALAAAGDPQAGTAAVAGVHRYGR